MDIGIYRNDAFDIVIQAGQSNAEGCGVGRVTGEYTPNELILYMNSDLTITVACEAVGEFGKINNFSLSFAEEYVRGGKLVNGRKLLILRAAVGGTGFADKHWGKADDLYLKMMEMIKTALELNPENKLVAFLWHQGETDAGYGSSFDTHYNNLKGLVESVRDTYKYPALPFVAGNFVSEWKNENSSICEPVINAIKGVCNDIGNAGFSETADLPSNNQDTGNGDTIHFSRESLYKLGIRYFNIWESLV